MTYLESLMDLVRTLWEYDSSNKRKQRGLKIRKTLRIAAMIKVAGLSKNQ
jgi:hypothetical protein